MAGVRCEGHDDLVRSAGMTLQAAQEHTRQLSDIFGKLEDIKTAVDQNQVRAMQRDEAVENLQCSVKAVDVKIENGLRSEVRQMSECIKKMVEAAERRKAVRDEEARTGIRGFLATGWGQFKRQASLILVAGTLILSAWFVIFVTTKIGFFHEGPLPILKLFGIGG
jgi:hypothetical protein